MSKVFLGFFCEVSEVMLVRGIFWFKICYRIFLGFGAFIRVGSYIFFVLVVFLNWVIDFFFKGLNIYLGCLVERERVETYFCVGIVDCSFYTSYVFS